MKKSTLRRLRFTLYVLASITLAIAISLSFYTHISSGVLLETSVETVYETYVCEPLVVPQSKL
jgi:hypothetical protein